MRRSPPGFLNPANTPFCFWRRAARTITTGFTSPLGVGRLLTDPKFVWGFNTEPEAELHDQTVYWPREKLLGGSSSVNGMLYVRGAPHKYDEWRDGNEPGWGYEELLPYFRKIEDRPESDHHPDRGQGGPIRVSSGNYRDPLSAAFREACVQAGAESNDDYNVKYEGVSWLQYSTSETVGVTPSPSAT